MTAKSRHWTKPKGSSETDVLVFRSNRTVFKHGKIIHKSWITMLRDPFSKRIFAVTWASRPAPFEALVAYIKREKKLKERTIRNIRKERKITEYNIQSMQRRKIGRSSGIQRLTMRMHESKRRSIGIKTYSRGYLTGRRAISIVPISESLIRNECLVLIKQ